MWKHSKRTLAVLAVAVAVGLVWGGLSLSAPPSGKGGGGDKTVPGGPGLIAFNDEGVITLMNPDGSGLTPVALADRNFRKPAWSPVFCDGSVKLAYPETDPETRIEFLMVVEVFPSVGDAIPVVGLERQDGIFQVDWSPAELLEDGTESVRVCFSTFEDLLDLDLRRQVIHIVDLIYDPSAGVFVVDPASPDPLVLDPGPGSGYWQARFSPDGQWLALASDDFLMENGYYHKSIWLASADGVIQVPWIDGPSATDWYPAWSPDGSQLAFISSRDGRSEIFVASFDEQMHIVSIQRVTNSRKVYETWPTWSPDGLQIAYHYSKGVGKVIVATGEQFKLAEGQWPDWSPLDLPPLP